MAGPVFGSFGGTTVVSEPDAKGWFSTLPGILTGLSALIGGLTGLVAAVVALLGTIPPIAKTKPPHEPVVSKPQPPGHSIATSPIDEKWLEMGGGLGHLGLAKTEEREAIRGGRYIEYKYGYIYWHPDYGAHAVYGAIGEKWDALTREGDLGFPLTDELAAAGGGRYNDFENNATITWQDEVGAHAVRGLIRDRWIALGRERGCGFPVSEEHDIKGGRKSEFQRGSIVWLDGQTTAKGQCGA